MKILITGAAGNLGSRLAQHLLSGPHELRLMVHKSPLPFDVSGNASVCRADLAQPATLRQACAGIDCIVHFAGVLFAPLPERFLPKTNVGYVKNLVEAAKTAGVRRFILISFPQVEGETTPDRPATGRLDTTSEVIHFRTRLEAEKFLFEACQGTSMAAVVFRSGMVYGDGIKMVEGARWMLRHRLMAVWKGPTWTHLIALPDFLAALQAAIEKDNVSGIYQVCDDAPLTLQDFLDKLAARYNCARPWRFPAWMFHLAGASCEIAALILRTAAPLNRDIVKAGMTSCVADTSRMKHDLLPVLAYPSFDEGVKLISG
ncbi:MAG: NAD(P)-dependent oxidoreductase [Acidobacteriia bacterium]|nr:NAD(P)-dependent oxidoreductase [Terriglobia bacterium]